MNSYSTSWWSLLLIYRPREDERLSWPCWLTYSRRFTHINGYSSAAGLVQTSESSPIRDRRSTTEPPNQYNYTAYQQYHYTLYTYTTESVTHGQCDTRFTLIFPLASPSFAWCQIILFDDRGTCVWTTCQALVTTWKWNNQESNPQPVDHKSNALTITTTEQICSLSNKCLLPLIYQWQVPSSETVGFLRWILISVTNTTENQCSTVTLLYTSDCYYYTTFIVSVTVLLLKCMHMFCERKMSVFFCFFYNCQWQFYRSY